MIKEFLRKKYDGSSKRTKKIVRGVICYIPFIAYQRSHFWFKNVYNKFGQEKRNYIFMTIARFLRANRPIKGYYFEFGCCEANTMRMAWDAFHYLQDFTFVAFDSFEGFPEISEGDKQEIFEKGKAKMSEHDFVKVVTRHGMAREKLIVIKGFYDKTLTPELKEKLLPSKAAVIYIDCDLYTSTVPVLNFIKEFLQKGTIIVFDDWHCFYGDPERGERRAFKEFREQNLDLIFEDFISTGEQKSFVFLGKYDKRTHRKS